MRFNSPLLVATLLAAGLWTAPGLAATVLADNFNSDSPLILNWTGDSVFTATSPPGSVDLIGPGFYDLYPGNGNYVDLDGSTGNGNDPAGQLTSVLSLPAGSYELTFDLGGNARGYHAQTTDISFGNFSAQITLDSSDPLALHSYSFVTTGGNLVFTELGPSNQQGNILDNVVLTAVPEPGIWAMLLIGFFGVGMMMRKTRPQAAFATV